MLSLQSFVGRLLHCYMEITMTGNSQLIIILSFFQTIHKCYCKSIFVMLAFKNYLIHEILT